MRRPYPAARGVGAQEPPDLAVAPSPRTRHVCGKATSDQAADDKYAKRRVAYRVGDSDSDGSGQWDDHQEAYQPCGSPDCGGDDVRPQIASGGEVRLLALYAAKAKDDQVR